MKFWVYFGLATKAGKICFGADSVEAEIKKRKVKLVFLARDSSERTQKKYQVLCQEYQVPIIIGEEIAVLSKTIGKENKAIIGVKDSNFANQIQKIYNGGDVIG